jgi:hypothetical protein
MLLRPAAHALMSAARRLLMPLPARQDARFTGVCSGRTMSFVFFHTPFDIIFHAFDIFFLSLAFVFFAITFHAFIISYLLRQLPDFHYCRSPVSFSYYTPDAPYLGRHVSSSFIVLAFPPSALPL